MSKIRLKYTNWLGNLKKLDTKNHLIHGEIYASDGSVHDLEINSNHIKAKVDGIPGKQHDVEITFKSLDSVEIENLIEYIYDNSSIYFNLLNNRMPDELLEWQVNVFPKSLNDFEISCSCGRGLFCKHQAAVLHKLQHEISKDPFLIFSLRGLDLKDIFQSHNTSIKAVDDILRGSVPAVLDNSGNIDYLSKLRFMLSEYPSFYASNSINFKQLLCDSFASFAKCVNQIPSNREFITFGQKLADGSFKQKWSNPKRWKSFTINLNGNYELDGISTGEFENDFKLRDLKLQLFAFFAEMNLNGCKNYCGNIRFLHDLYLFTLQLIYLNALIPEFFSLENGGYHIRWIPTFEVSIFFKLKKFYDECPEDILKLNNSSLSSQNQVNAIISIFFEGFSAYYMDRLPKEIRRYSGEFYFRLFFGKTQYFNDPFHENMEIEVNNWLSGLYLKQKEYKFTIDILQMEFEFVLDLKINIRDEKYTIREMLIEKRFDIVSSVSVINNIFSIFDFEYDLSNPRALKLQEFSFFIDKISPVLKRFGINVDNPKVGEIRDVELFLDTALLNPNASLSIDNLVDFDWKIAIGNDTYSIDEFEAFSKSYGGLLKIKDRFYFVSEKDLDRLSKDLDKIPKTKSKSQMIRFLLGSDSKDFQIDTRLHDLLEKSLEISDYNVPDTFKGNLRPYQVTGFSWMLQNIRHGFGSILADDMGLGKTIQLLAVISYLKENVLLGKGKVLIVVPTSILTNWVKEIRKFAPSLRVKVYHGLNRVFPEGGYDILLTSYGVIRRDYEDFNMHDWFLIVVDEAQYIKNPKSKQSMAVKAIKASHHIALSGTPVENHLSEYWSIFDFINRGYLNTLKHFHKKFIRPIEKNHDENVLNDFKRITSPFILRRLKTDKRIIRDLPEKIVNDVHCNLTLKQASLYEETLNQLIRDVEGSTGIKRKGMVLKLITALKQICNHPAQFTKAEDFKVTESGKMEVLIDILENIIRAEEKVIIFTQYVEMGNIMKELIERRFGEEAMFLHGAVSRKMRDEMVEKFQNGDNQIFILSLKAGGIGLNLTAAHHVIHYDLWWNPAVENQATDRAYRIGQKDNVMVYRFITSGTLEERINQILRQKRRLVEMTVDGNETFITEMTNDELKEMLNLRKEH